MIRPAIAWLLAATTLSAAAQNYPVETVIQRGHSDAIRVLEFSHDSHFMVTGSDDHSLKLWDLRWLREIRTFKGHEHSLKAAHISRDKSFIISATASVTSETDIMVWDINTGKSKQTIETGSWRVSTILRGTAQMSLALQALALSPDDETIAWGEDNYGVRIGSIRHERFDKTLETTWDPNAIIFSPDGKWLIAGPLGSTRLKGSNSKEIRVWSAPKFNDPRSIPTQYETTHEIQLNKSGTKLAFRTSDSINNHQVVVMAFPSMSEEYKLDIKQQEVSLMAFSSAGDWIAMVSPGKEGKEATIALYSLPAKTPVRTLLVDEPSLFSMRFSPNGKLLVAAGLSIHTFSTATWERLERISPPARIDNLEIDPSGPSLMMTRTNEGERSMFHLNLNTLEYRGFGSRQFSAFKYWSSGEEQFMLRAEADKIMRYGHDGTQRLGPFTASLSPLTSISTFEANAQYLVGAEWSKPEVSGFNLVDKKPVTLKAHSRGTTALALNGNWLLTGGKDNKIVVWDLGTGERKAELLGHNKPITAIAMSPDQTLVASGSEDAFVRLWDAKTGARLGAFPNHGNDVSAVTFSPGGKYFTSGTGDLMFGGRSELIQWDPKKKKPLFNIQGNDGYIKKIIYHPGEEQFFSIGNDPLVRAWNAQNGKPLYSIVPVDTTNYIIFTPDNYYAFTRSKQSLVHFVQGTKVFSLENFDLKYNRPDIVLKRMGSTNETLISGLKKAYNRRLKKLSFTEELLTDELHTPDIRIENLETIANTTAETSVTIQVRATDTKYPLARLFVMLNDVPWFGLAGLKIDGSLKRYDKDLTLPLVPGKNKVKVSVLNSKGVESSKEQVVVYRTSRDTDPSLQIIVACVAKYKQPSMNLTYSVKDGKDFAAIFNKAPGWSSVRIDSLFNEKMTRENFRALKRKLLNTRPQDHVVLLMAGHGLLDLNFDFYFGTYDVDPENPAANCVPYDDIEWLMDSIPAQNKLVLLDACHSGGVDKDEVDELAKEYVAQKEEAEKEQAKAVEEKKLRRGVTATGMDKLKLNLYKSYGVNHNTVEMMQEMFTNLSRGSGSVVISAAAGYSYALESEEWRNGVFTYALKEALVDRRADTNKDGKVTANELKRYVTRRVFDLTGGQQKPTARSEVVEFDFVVK